MLLKNFDKRKITNDLDLHILVDLVTVVWEHHCVYCWFNEFIKIFRKINLKNHQLGNVLILKEIF